MAAVEDLGMEGDMRLEDPFPGEYFVGPKFEEPIDFLSTAASNGCKIRTRIPPQENFPTIILISLSVLSPELLEEVFALCHGQDHK